MVSTGLDSAGPIPGYYDSPWPAECGGPRRQKTPRSPGLDLRPGTRLVQHTSTNGEWDVMMVLRAPGEVNGFLYFKNGDRCCKQDADCNVLAARTLPGQRRVAAVRSRRAAPPRARRRSAAAGD